MIDDLVRLRLSAWADYSEYLLDTEDARRAIRDALEEQLDTAEAVRVLKGPIRAAVILSRLRSKVYGVVQRCRVECSNEAEALAWVARTLAELRPRFDPTFTLTLEHGAILPLAGLSARMRHYHGSPALALERLRPKALPKGLRIEQLCDERHVEEVVALLRDIFRDDPELGYISPLVPLTAKVQQRLDAFVRDGMQAALRDGTHFLVLSGERVLGHAGLQVTRDDPLLGSSAGVSIALHASIRDRGVGTELYRRLAARMVELELRVMCGKTANPAVVHLAERMGRAPRAHHVELSRG
jgi:hypothetical protein